MDKLKRKLENREHFIILLRNGFYQGMGWAIGVTVGFAIVSSILVYSLNLAGGLPIIGQFFANIVEATITTLEDRNFIESQVYPSPVPRR